MYVGTTAGDVVTDFLSVITDIVLALAVCFELTALVVTIASCNGTTTAGGLAVAAAFASLFGLMGCMYAVVWASPYLEGAEKNIEGRLKKALSRNGPGED